MLTPTSYMLFYCIPVLFQLATCVGGALKISSPGELEYAAVLVKRVGDNLTLDCTYSLDSSPRLYVWNYVPANSSAPQHSAYNVSVGGGGSRLVKMSLTLHDSGHYVCSAPPHSASKALRVQTRGPLQCARGAFWCGMACVLAGYVCDGRRDCRQGEDEDIQLCGADVCNRPDMLNCSDGRCIPEAACCGAGGVGGAAGGSLCRQPSCCDEHPKYARHEGYAEDYPPLYEDRRAPDEYGFIQSTIYTVTACALIFMIAVVLLVSAICKMHMKRAALHSLARDRGRHYTPYTQALRFPPCYETSRLLEQRERALDLPASGPTAGNSPGGAGAEGGGFTRLAALWGRPHYTQAPTSPPAVELRSLPPSPSRDGARAPPAADLYRSPYAHIDDQLFFSADTESCGRELNYMARPVELYRSSAMGGSETARARPLTLQLGRFQLSIPLLGRRQTATDRRPDTPNVAELNIDDLDFVRLNSNDTYTLNGRTIRLLGANFENYPLLNDDNPTRPPPYTEAVRYKLYGPPPEYLSRDALNDGNGNERQSSDNGNVIPSPVTATEQQARSNVEEPPCYEDLASGVDANANNVSNGPGNDVILENNLTRRPNNNSNDTQLVDSDRSDNVIAGSNAVITRPTTNGSALNSCNATNNVVAALSSVIDNLPAIDSDVNANETEVRYSVTNNGNNNNNVNNVC